MIRLSKKFIRRGITGLALLAPLVYLFGSQFFALAGAHGDSGLGGDYPLPVSAKVLPFRQMNRAVDVSSSYGSNYSNLVVSNDVVSFDTLGSGYVNVTHPAFPSSFIGHVCVTTFFVNVLSGSFLCDGVHTASYAFLSSRVTYPVGTHEVYCRFVPSGSNLSSVVTFSGISSVEYSRASFQSFDLTAIYGAGNEPSYEQFRNDFPNEYYPYSSTFANVTIEEYGIPSYSQFLFNQFFSKNNFLEQWGQDAISDNPHGFAPFGNMLQFVDENMLHLSDLQIGLMGYGYFYYCAHVLLFVCFFDLTTFFLSWILRITHKFGGADYED